MGLRVEHHPQSSPRISTRVLETVRVTVVVVISSFSRGTFSDPIGPGDCGARDLLALRARPEAIDADWSSADAPGSGGRCRSRVRRDVVMSHRDRVRIRGRGGRMAQRSSSQGEAFGGATGSRGRRDAKVRRVIRVVWGIRARSLRWSAPRGARARGHVEGGLEDEGRGITGLARRRLTCRCQLARESEQPPVIAPKRPPDIAACAGPRPSKARARARRPSVGLKRSGLSRAFCRITVDRGCPTSR